MQRIYLKLKTCLVSYCEVNRLGHFSLCLFLEINTENIFLKKQCGCYSWVTDNKKERSEKREKEAEKGSSKTKNEKMIGKEKIKGVSDSVNESLKEEVEFKQSLERLNKLCYECNILFSMRARETDVEKYVHSTATHRAEGGEVDTRRTSTSLAAPTPPPTLAPLVLRGFTQCTNAALTAHTHGPRCPLPIPTCPGQTLLPQDAAQKALNQHFPKASLLTQHFMLSLMKKELCTQTCSASCELFCTFFCLFEILKLLCPGHLTMIKLRCSEFGPGNIFVKSVKLHKR